jgi:hypothetical protein
MKLLIFLIAASSIVLSPVAHAQDPEGAVTVQEGDPAPFSGTLLTNEAAATLLAEIQVCSERASLEYELELERQKSTCDLEKTLLEIRLDSQKQMYENIVSAQDQQLDYTLKVRNPRLSREASFVIGVASGILLTTASAYAINLASNGN